MSEENAFLAAIKARPDDDLPRLVYADWLDERDDPRGLIVRTETAMNTAVTVAGGNVGWLRERGRRKWAYRGWRRRYPRAWVEAIGRWGAEGEVVHHHFFWSGSFHHFAVVVRETARTVLLVELAAIEVEVSACGRYRTKRPAHPDEWVFPVAGPGTPTWQWPGVRKAVKRDQGPASQPLFLSREERFFFWDGADKTNEMGG
jgi:uncharacterized protein (TIGR02996 family)